jgi:hypothetical protein
MGPCTAFEGGANTTGADPKAGKGACELDILHILEGSPSRVWEPSVSCT